MSISRFRLKVFDYFITLLYNLRIQKIHRFLGIFNGELNEVVSESLQILAVFPSRVSKQEIHHLYIFYHEWATTIGELKIFSCPELNP